MEKVSELGWKLRAKGGHDEEDGWQLHDYGHISDL
jgi:hypothetical protein